MNDLAVGQGSSTSETIPAPTPDTVELTTGFAEILRVDGNVGTIVVGDPAIVDASPVNSRTILITALSAGTTNMILLDEGSGVLADVVLHVRSRQPRTVTVNRALEAQIYTCEAGLCEGSLKSSSGGTDPVVALAAEDTEQ